MCIQTWLFNTSLLYYLTIQDVVLKLLGGISGGSKDFWFFMSQHRKNSTRGKVIDKKWFIGVGCLWGLQVGRWAGVTLWELSGLQFYNQWKVGRVKDHLLPHSWVDIMLPSSVPPPRQAGEFSCPYMIKLGLSWRNGNEQKDSNIC